MKKPIVTLATISLVSVCLFILFGCATPNPQAGQPVVTQDANGTHTNTQPDFLPNKTGTGIVNTGNQVAPFLPPPYNTLALALLGLATATMTTIAGIKNGQVKTANATVQSQQSIIADHVATITQLATSVAAQGPAIAQAVIGHASNFPGAGDTAVTAINAALPPDALAPAKTI